MKDLFGIEVPHVEPDRSNESQYQRFKRENHYRRSEGAARCKTCEFRNSRSHNSKNYHKCFLVGDSFSPATDIALRNICDKHKPKE